MRAIILHYNKSTLIFLECNAAIHKKCIDKIIGRCTGTAANSRDTVVSISVFLIRGSICNFVSQTVLIQPLN